MVNIEFYRETDFQCDECGKEFKEDKSYIIDFSRSNVELCKSCIDDLKDLIQEI